MERLMLFLIQHFPNLLDLNLTVSVVIVFIMCARVLMKDAPKIFSYALWGVVLLRLLIPISVESPFSFVPERTEFSSMVDVNEVFPEMIFETPSHAAFDQLDREHILQEEVPAQTYSALEPQGYLTLLWLGGISVMLIWSAASYGNVCRKIRIAVQTEKGIWVADDIQSPFVIGFLRPRIYLPSALAEREWNYIILHEKHHIRRGDHIIKWLAWLALTIHWFNPLVWAAFILAGRDMEMSCDEAVLKRLGPEVRADYSESLLTLATGRRVFAGAPLLFGESDTRGRILNISRWKKPAVWIIVVCIAVCSVLAVCLLTDPEIPEPEKTVDFADLDVAAVTEVTLQNCHNGIFTHIMDPVLVDEICDIIKSIYGSNGISGKGYYEGSYSVVLYNADEKMMSIGFGDTDSFFHGKGEDGYPIRYELEGLSIDGVIRLLSEYDTSGFDWYRNEKASRWGVELYAQDVTDSGLTAVFALSVDMLSSDFLEKNALYVGESYQLERKEDGQWMALKRFDGESSVHGAAEKQTPITANSTGRVSLDWTDRCGRLDPGEYRIGMQITRLRDGEEPETLPIYAEFSTTALSNNYGVSIQVYESDAEHVILTFHREGDERDTNFSRMNGYSLEKLDDGIWKYLDLGMDWGDSQVHIDFERSSQPRNGLYLEWTHLGELEPGKYRIGQHILSGTGVSFPVYAEFSVTDMEESGPKPLDKLPNWYSMEQAQSDGCVTFRYGSIDEINAEKFLEFLENSDAGIFSGIRCASWDDNGMQLYDLAYDGLRYIVRFLEADRVAEKKYPYLLRFAGAAEAQMYDEYEVYVLTNDSDLTWEMVRNCAFDFRHSSGASWHVVYSRKIVHPKNPVIPEAPVLYLDYEEETLLHVDDRSAVEAVRAMFSEATLLGYEPKTYNLGPSIRFQAIDGTEKSVILDLYSDMFFYEGQFYQFGDPDQDDTAILLSYLGLKQWPERAIIP